MTATFELKCSSLLQYSTVMVIFLTIAAVAFTQSDSKVTYVTGFAKTIPNKKSHTFGILRNTYQI